MKQKLEVRYIASECSMYSLRSVPARTPRVSMPSDSGLSGSFMLVARSYPRECSGLDKPAESGRP
ncbi:hypothetical protein ACTMU2_28140 [Cupriavidus basilensis]